DTYYWCCEKRKSLECKGRAITKFINNLHYLKQFNDHNHTPQASSAEVAKSIAHIKELAKETNDQPAQVIQNTIISISEEIYPYVPSQNALRNLDDIDIPNSLCLTLNGENFLVRDSIIGEDRIILFTTKANIQHLSRALYWIMDGTFKTVPTIFHQLYTIHAPIGTADNSRVLPLVYALMTNKSEES
ncbi:31189_t:CDS:2, partial [Gigaspora margarita]